MQVDLYELLAGNPYPGRGIVLGLLPDGQNALLAYFIMGRSKNSRNRIFSRTADGIETQAADPSNVQDSSLILYSPVRHLSQYTIVSNGNQTDTIHAALQGGGSFEDALRTRSFEPDAPHFTPRISALLQRDHSFSGKLSILKSEGAGQSVRRYFWEYPQLLPGNGFFIHTYAAPENPLPSFEGEPRELLLPDNAQAFAEGLWQALDHENKISLFVESISLNGDKNSILLNKYTAK